jgi:hypothetical protein
VDPKWRILGWSLSNFNPTAYPTPFYDFQPRPTGTELDGDWSTKTAFSVCKRGSGAGLWMRFSALNLSILGH